MQQKPTFLIIMGMHRSGTSCLTGSLQQHGVHLGEVIELAPYNLKGNREKKDIMSLNDSILTISGGTWDKPPSKIIWDVEHVIERTKIIKSLEESNENICGFKDPRCTFTLPFWQDGLDNIKMVASFRHPLLVARSLNTRSKIPINEGLALWKAYNMKLLSHLNKAEFPLISFDTSQEEYLSIIKRIVNSLGLNGTADINVPFYDDSLKHQKLSHLMSDLPNEICKLYDDLTQVYLEQTATST